MKKKIFVMLMVVLMVVGFAGCGNKKIFDTTYTFEYAICELPNGEVIEGEVESWTDYDGEQLQITFKDGDTYLVSSINTAMISRRKK